VVAVGAVVVLTAVNYTGIQRAAWLTRLIVALVIGVLAVVVAVCFAGSAAVTAVAAGPASVVGAAGPVPFVGPAVAAATAGPASGIVAGSVTGTGFVGVVRAAALLFFAFAGYARIATLGEEVRDPARTIPRAIPLALGITLVVYAAVAVALLRTLGTRRLAGSAAPLADAVRAAGVPALVPLVTVGAAVAALGSLLALILGVSRTTLAMARDHHLPGALAAVHPRFEVPHRAELAVGAVVAITAAVADLRAVIGFSSFGVLCYYAIANASAWTLATRWRVVSAVGLAGCLLLAVLLPLSSVISGVAVLGVGIVIYMTRRGNR
jgi:APA family basic amino acid/polyamine antiporter